MVGKKAIYFCAASKLTRADGVVDALELVARREVLALGRDAAEVVRVVLEAMTPG